MAPPQTILIVDDTPVGRDTLEALLYKQGYNLAFASSGPETLTKAEELMPDLILLDVMMPGMNGFEVCRRLRENPILAEVPVIMVTALDDQSSRVKGIEAGADDFITKPFNRVELRARVNTILRLNRYRTLQDERSRLISALENLQAAYDETIRGWGYALDLRDDETQGHSTRVTQLTEQIAIKIGVPPEEILHIKRGAILHDIGKIGIPDSILLKNGPLSDEEWEVMKQHPRHGFDMLSRIEYLKSSLDIPYCHHERWDGSGYPRGLKGEEIPLSARIFAIVDVWDALNSDRPYRRKWPHEKIIHHIREQSGKHFDPAIVPAFLELAENFED
ncbi:MAG: response regulator [Anaerolineaceae bacterium]|jgi:putative two-component system response regulator|nr:response regulator [Anaerolineaceae bacterium]